MLKEIIIKLKDLNNHYKELEGPFTHYNVIMMSVICLGNLLFLVRELSIGINYLLLICTRLTPVAMAIAIFLLRKKYKILFSLSGLIISMLCGIGIGIQIIFVNDGSPFSGEGMTLYYIVTALSLAPMAFSPRAHLLALFSIWSYTHLLWLSGPGGKCHFIISRDFPMSVAQTGIIAYILGVMISFFLYLENYRSAKRKAELENSLNTDPLTQVYNRYWINRHEKIANCILVVVDFDNFKKINDTYGHDAGDLALKSTSRIIKECLRETESIARFGGDEFILILDRDRRMREFKEEVDKKLKDFYAGQAFDSTVTMGCTEIEDYMVLEEALKRADKFLYTAKKIKKQKETTTNFQYCELSSNLEIIRKPRRRKVAEGFVESLQLLD